MRIVNHPRFLAVMGLCCLAFLMGLPANIGNLSFISFALGQTIALTKAQSDALDAYNKTVQDFRSILSERRADQCKSKAAGRTRTSALPCARHHDGRVQGSHRRGTVQNRKAE